MSSQAYQGFGAGYSRANEDRSALRNSLVPRLEQMAGQSETPEEKATKARTLEAIDASGDAANQQIQNRVARTRNSAGAFAAMSDAATQREQAKAGALRDLAGQRLQRQQGALAQLGQTYGIDTNLLGNMGNLQLGALNAYGQGIGHGGFNIAGLGGANW